MFIGIIVSLVVAWILGELAVRKWVPSEEEHYYRFDKANRLYRRQPRLEGPWQKRNVKGYFILNNEGWNSTRDYFKEHREGVYRIACIGTSETGCYQVHVKDAWPKILEDKLNSMGVKCEVYTFAADRSYGFSHALHLTRYVINNFTPDLIIYNSSFSESSLVGTTNKKHYALFDIDDKGNVKEIPPVNDKLPLLGQSWSFKSLFFQSQLIKYLRPKLAIRTRIKKLLGLFGISVFAKPVKSMPNPKVTAKPKGLDSSKKMEIAIRYFLTQLKETAEKNKVKILFGVQVLRGRGFNWSSLADPDSRETQQKAISMKKSYLEAYNIPYFDLTEDFEQDFLINKKKFDFLLDPHTNQQGCRVEGEAIAKYLMEHNYFKP